MNDDIILKLNPSQARSFLVDAIQGHDKNGIEMLLALGVRIHDGDFALAALLSHQTAPMLDFLVSKVTKYPDAAAIYQRARPRVDAAISIILLGGELALGSQLRSSMDKFAQSVGVQLDSVRTNRGLPGGPTEPGAGAQNAQL